MTGGRVADGGSADVRRLPLTHCLEEISQGVGSNWHEFRVLGATRAGIAPAKEGVGQHPERYKLVEPGTIFYNPMRILLGSIAMLEEGEEPGITSPDYVVFRMRPGVLHYRWFYYWLRSSDGDAFIRSLARGAVRERMLFRRLATGEIRVPSWEQQLQFARRMPALERARAAAEAELEAAKALPVSYLRAVFGRAEAQKWPRRRLGAVAVRITDGTHQPPPFVPHGIPFLFVRNIVGGRIDFNVEKHVSYVTYEKLVRACRPERGDVLYSAVGSFGVAVVVDTDRPFTFQRHIAHIKPRRDLVEPYFLCSYLNSPEGRRESDAAALGGAQRTVTLGSLAGFEVPIPAIEIQRRIAASVTAWSAKLEVIRAQVEEQVASISTLPAAFLRQAFSGEL